MAEIGVAASVVGIIATALHGVNLLLQDIQNLKDTPKKIKRLGEEARSVEDSLKLLQAIESKEWDALGNLVAKNSAETISSCSEACKQFRADLQHWTRHSEGDKLALIDRTKVAFLKQGQIETMSDQLKNCKLSITSTVGVANLYSSVRQSHITEEIRTMISTRQAEISSAVTVADTQVAVVNQRLANLELSDDDDDQDEGAGNKQATLQQLQEERKALDSSRKLLQELLLKSSEEAVAKAARAEPGATTVTFGSNNSGFQAHTATVNGGMTFGR